jgi:drug/metabolite transporter, DME family
MPSSVPVIVHVLALSSAILSAAATIFIRQGLRTGGSYAGFWINIAVGAVALWTAVLLTGGIGHATLRGVVLFVLAGIIGTVAGRFLRFMAIERLGAAIASPLNNLNPLVSTGLAIVLLGERVTVPILAGTVVIIAGATLLSMGGRQVGFRARYLALPILSAVCFGTVAIFRKLALADIGAIAGTAINVTTALVVFSSFLIASGDRRGLVCDGPSLGYFIGAGLAENLSVFLTVVALGFGTVSVVTPLTSTSPIFVLLLSPLLLRGVERITGRIVLGTVLIVLGVYFITGLGH